MKASHTMQMLTIHNNGLVRLVKFLPGAGFNIYEVHKYINGSGWHPILMDDFTWTPDVSRAMEFYKDLSKR